ncbi:MAG: bifunctional adenosylcobinamide kinase/adenosylcobinamide-phosphate guanylyltransferase [Acidimicrobiales bacterium]
MSLTFLVGGARSGKSRLAVSLAEASGAPVTFIATGEARDDEMAERIARHRRDRPADWVVVEEPVELGRAVAAAADPAFVVVDCLTLWVANLLELGLTDDAIATRAREAAKAAASRVTGAVAVSNEVGLGVVAMDPVGRRYTDLLGRINAIWAEVADRAAFVIAGRALALADPFEVLDGR